MNDEIIRRISKAIIETPNASDYKTLVAKNAIKALMTITDAEAKVLETDDDHMVHIKCFSCGGHVEGMQNILRAILNEDLCEDEGCPNSNISHVCITK